MPKRLQNPKRRTIGIRVPDNAIVRMLLAELGEPIMSSTLLLPGETHTMTDPHEIKERLDHLVDLVIDGGHWRLRAEQRRRPVRSGRRWSCGAARATSPRSNEPARARLRIIAPFRRLGGAARVLR